MLSVSRETVSFETAIDFSRFGKNGCAPAITEQVMKNSRKM
jgi:hypothetical protein